MFFGILNSLFALKNSTSDVPQWRMAKKDKFYLALTQEFIDYKVTQSDLGELKQEELHLPYICHSSLRRP